MGFPHVQENRLELFCCFIMSSAPSSSNPPFGLIPLTCHHHRQQYYNSYAPKRMVGWPLGTSPQDWSHRIPARTGMPNFSSSACLKNVVPLPLRLAYTFSCSGSLTPLQLTNHTRGDGGFCHVSHSQDIFWLTSDPGSSHNFIVETDNDSPFPTDLPSPSHYAGVPDSSSIGS